MTIDVATPPVGAAARGGKAVLGLLVPTQFLITVDSTVTNASIGAVLVLWLFLGWQRHLASTGGAPLVDPSPRGFSELTGSLSLLLVQYLAMMGVFTESSSSRSRRSRRRCRPPTSPEQSRR